MVFKIFIVEIKKYKIYRVINMLWRIELKQCNLSNDIKSNKLLSISY